MQNGFLAGGSCVNTALAVEKTKYKTVKQSTKQKILTFRKGIVQCQGLGYGWRKAPLNVKGFNKRVLPACLNDKLERITVGVGAGNPRISKSCCVSLFTSVNSNSRQNYFSKL